MPKWTTAALACASGAVAWQALRRIGAADFRGASILITGGSRGLGLELARCFAEEGALLTLLARDAGELEEARRQLARTGADVLVYACDVAEAEAAAAAVRFVQEARGRIDVLVNNAGIIQVGPVEHMDRRDFEEALAVHTWGPLNCMQQVIPGMRAQGGGRIVNISSIGGLVAVPHLLPYVTSKFALTGLSDGMRAELAKDGIHVTTVCPGLMRTGSHVNAFFKGHHEKEYAWFAVSASSRLTSTDSRSAAKRIVAACKRGAGRLIITPQARLLHAMNALAPDVTATLQGLAARMLPGPDGEEGDARKKGLACGSDVAPSSLTRLGDEAAVRNNEVPAS